MIEFLTWLPVIVGVGFTVYQTGHYRGFREGCALYRAPYGRVVSRAIQWRKLWRYHRAKGARLRRKLWEVRKALEAKAE